MTRRQKRARVLFIVLIVLAVPFGVLTNRWLIHPVTTNPTSADVVVVLGGGHGERLDTGLALMAAKVAPVLVLSTGIHWVEPPNVVKAIKDMCAEASVQFEGWRRIVVVTTDHHLTRSMRWFHRCVEGELFPVSAPAPTGVSEIAHEWAGTIDQFTFDRTCSR
jgi:uncharacterized SAM-binding protein YcdF (DUF218 family)